MNITFRQLKTFLALAEHCSITEAARADHFARLEASIDRCDRDAH